MVRKLALAVSIALGTLNVPAHALGLGELTSKSLLNQDFRGDITLLSVAPDDIDTIRVKLADAEAFSRAGVERPFYLSLLKFQPQLGAGGKPVVRVSSDFPIREPFLNFLIEVNWPNGRLLREYTVLLDPPTTTTRRPPKPVAPQVQARPAPAPVAPVVTQPRAEAPVAATPAPSVGTSDGGEYGPVRSGETAWSIAKKLRPSGISMEQMMMALLNANPDAFVDGNINRLRRGRILRVPALDGIQEMTRQQARAAYRAQQDQWLARRDARMQAKVADQETTPAGKPAAPAASDDQLRIATARPEGEGEAGASEDDSTRPTTPDLQSRLIVARENAETSRQEAETLRSEVEDLQARLEDMQKLLSLKDEQLARLQDQVATGEAGPAAAEDVIDRAMPAVDDAPAAESAEAIAETEAADDLVDGLLADMESAATETPVADAFEAAVPYFVPPPGYELPNVTPLVDVDAIVAGREIAPVVGEPEVAPLVDVDAIVEGRATAPAIEEAVEQPVVEAPAEPVQVEVPAVVVAETERALEAELTPPPAEEPKPVEPVAEPVVVEETAAKRQILPPGLAALVEDNIVPLAGGGVALIGLIGWLATRRRKQEAGEESMPPVADEVDKPGVDEPAVAAETLEDLPDSAFLDEFSPNDINSLQDETGEVDPVSEADVYIAYGRYQQAQELLAQALERDPDRLALKHKLLEVHYATRDGDAFAQLAQEMVEAGQDVADEAAWARAQDMGRELQPANPLFSDREGSGSGAIAGAALAAGAAAAAEAATPVDEDTLSLGDLDLSDLDDEYEVDKPSDEPVDQPSEVSITLDLDEASDSLDALESDLEMPDIPESLSLDEVESLDLDELDGADSAKETADEPDTVSDSFDLDSMMAEAEAAIDADDTTLNLDSDFSADELQAELDQLSDLSVLDSALDEADEAKAEAVEASDVPADLGLVEEDLTTVEAGLDEPLDVDKAFDATEAAAPETESMAVEPTGDAADEDDVSTKLDLARAYVEMGDEEGARSILEEVVAEGSAGQKDEAQQLLAEIA